MTAPKPRKSKPPPKTRPAKPRRPAAPKPSRNGTPAQPLVYTVDQPPPNSGPEFLDRFVPFNQDGTTTEGRLMSQVKPQIVSWFVEQWVARGCLSLVVGPRNCGKGTFGAWLSSLAQRPAIIPGWEESTEHMLIPRLLKAGCVPHRVRILDQKTVSLPSDARWLTSVLRTHQCDLLWIDPIDSVMSEESRRDGSAVRAGLESLARLAHDLGIPVIGVRHPGKLAGNVCRGFTEWQDVPRQILELQHDLGPPERRTIRRWKDPWGWGRQPREFTLEGEAGQPRTFKLGGLVDEDSLDSTASLEPVDRWQIDQAEKLIRAVLAEGEQDSVMVYGHAERERIGERTMRRAARRIPVHIYRDGHGASHKSVWSLNKRPDSPATPATPDRDSDTPLPPPSQ